MRPEEYYVTQGWMYALGLTDKERTAYAIIWGYSRDGRSVCRTTAKQLAEWLDCSERHAKRIVNGLEDRGLIEHQVVGVPARRNHPGGVMTDFWAVLPDEAEKPTKKDRIDWVGRGKVGTWMSRPGRDMDVPTPLISTTKNKHISGGGGKKTTRSRANSTTTTGFLFENESGLAPGDPQVLRLPFEETFFREAWAALLRQPKWQGKTPEALQIVLDRLAAPGDCYIATWCCMKAIEKGWDTIKDPQAIADADWEAMIAWSNVADQKEKEVKA